MLPKLGTEKKQKTLPIEHEMSKTYDVFVLFFEGRKLVSCLSHEGRADRDQTTVMPAGLATRPCGAVSKAWHLFSCRDLTKIMKYSAARWRFYILPHELQNVCGDKTLCLSSAQTDHQESLPVSSKNA